MLKIINKPTIEDEINKKLEKITLLTEPSLFVNRLKRSLELFFLKYEKSLFKVFLNNFSPKFTEIELLILIEK